MHILAGDIGGTKTALGIFQLDNKDRLKSVVEREFPSREFSTLDAIITTFLEQQNANCLSAAFGIAGATDGATARATNLPWFVDAKALQEQFRFLDVQLLNDLEATASGIGSLTSHQIASIQQGQTSSRPGNTAVIAAGTGLGEAGLCWTGTTYQAFASEGGHAGFAPEGPRQRELLQFMTKRHGRVTWETVLSGRAMPDLFRFIQEAEGGTLAPDVRADLDKPDAGEKIASAGAAGRCPVCRRTTELFIELYGSAAGNLGLKLLAREGVYIAGGIAPKLRSQLTRDLFLEPFRDKPPMRSFLEAIPVNLVLEPRTALLGAARRAADMIKRFAS
jgi:glucokinase